MSARLIRVNTCQFIFLVSEQKTRLSRNGLMFKASNPLSPPVRLRSHRPDILQGTPGPAIALALLPIRLLPSPREQALQPLAGLVWPARPLMNQLTDVYESRDQGEAALNK